MKKFLVLFTFCIPLLTFSQNKEEKFGISFSGFVKTDVFYDTRQTVSLREGHFLLYPDSTYMDVNKKDMNAVPSFNILSIQSRLKGAISGPEAFGAKTSGVLEADFFGNTGTGLDDVNGFRLRHAFVKLNWKSAELLVGQYWHPMFIAESFPDVISFNTGVPFQPFSRNPQIRFTKKVGPVKLIACIYSQRDFQSTGPDGASTKYLRNSGIPDAHFQIQFKPDSADHVFGVGIDYKVLTPRLYNSRTTTTKTVITPESYTVDTTTWQVTHTNAVTATTTTTTKYSVNETIGSFSAIAFMKFKLKPVTIKLEGVYAQNAYDLCMIGGYAETKISNPVTGETKYTNLNTVSGWAEIQTNGKKIQFGLFTGYTKNIGAKDTIIGSFFARGSNLDNVFRVAPRFIFIAGKLNIALEIEHTIATYGKANGNSKGNITNEKAIANTRALLAFIYKF